MLKQSGIARWAQVGLVMATVLMPGMQHLLAESIVTPVTIQNDIQPKLLCEAHLVSPNGNLRLLEINQKIKEAIDKIQVLADRTEKKNAKQALQYVIQQAKNLRYAAKAKKLTQAKVDKALGRIDQIGKKYKYLRSAITFLQNDLDSSCREIVTESTKASEVGAEPITIISLPYTITQSGNYAITSDLVLTDASATGAAITVTADNVHLDLGNHTITVSPTIAALFVHDASNFTLVNGKLAAAAVSDSADSVGVLMNKVSHAVFDNIRFLNTYRGARSTNSQDLTFTNCQFTHPADEFFDGGRGIVAANGTKGLHVENCQFDLIGKVGVFLCSDEIGMEAATGSATIRNCKFLSSDGNMMGFAIALASRKDALPVTNVEISDCEFNYINCTIALEGVAGVEIRHCNFTDYGHGVRIWAGSDVLMQDCTFTRDWQTPFSAIQLVSQPGPITNIKIKDCTCTCNGLSAIEIWGHGNYIPSGVLIENCLFTSIDSPGTIVAASVTDLVVKNSVLRNSKQDDGCAAVNIGAGNAILDNCLLTGYIGCKLSGSTDCEIKNCTITEGVVGILLNERATNNTIKNNTISANMADGIFIDATSNSNTIIGNSVTKNGANGIFVTSPRNMVRGNTVSRNGSDGLLNTGDANIFLENASCTNGGANCTGLPDSTAILPGSPAVAGGNTCCQ